MLLNINFYQFYSQLLYGLLFFLKPLIEKIKIGEKDPIKLNDLKLDKLRTSK